MGVTQVDIGLGCPINIMLRIRNSGAGLPGFEFQLCHLALCHSQSSN